MMNLPALFTSLAAIAARLSMSWETTDVFKSYSVASAAAISVLVIALALAFIAFIGAISTKEILSEIFCDWLLWRVLSLAA